MRSLRRLVVTVLVSFMTMTQLVVPPAEAADATEVVFTGGGTVSPGLTLVPTNQSYSFSGTMTGVFVVGNQVIPGSVNCNFTASSTIAETELLGDITGQGSCTGAVTITCTFRAARQGCCWIFTAECRICWGQNCVWFRFVWKWCMRPTSPPGQPVTSFAVVGTGTAANTVS